MKFGKLEMKVNEEDRFGEATQYYRVLVVDPSGEFSWLLLTENEVLNGRARAQKNPEDLAQPSLADRLLAWLALR
jgi:hypothetical protein